MKQSFFEGLFSNAFFWALFFFIPIVQCLLVEYGGTVMGTCGLVWEQWLWSVGLALTELLCGSILRLIPIKDDTEQPLSSTAKRREPPCAAATLV